MAFKLDLKMKYYSCNGTMVSVYAVLPFLYSFMVLSLFATNILYKESENSFVWTCE